MAFKTKFKIEQLDDTYFKLLDDLVFESEIYGLRIRVPAGFVSDGPSVPRTPIIFMLFGHVGKRAAVVHDFLYRNLLVPRQVADDIFKEALISSNKGTTRAYLMYLGVRIGGWYNYGSRPGCLDIRRKCDGDCKNCKDSFLAYKLSCIKITK